MKTDEVMPVMLFYDINKSIIPFGKLCGVFFDENSDIDGVEIETYNDRRRTIKFSSRNDFYDFFGEVLKQASAFFVEKALYSTSSADIEYYKYKHVQCQVLLRDFIKGER